MTPIPDTYDRICAGESVPTDDPKNGDPLTVEEVDAALAFPAAAWMSSPSGETFEQLANAATLIVEGDRPLPAVEGILPSVSLGYLRSLTTYPGSDESVAYDLDKLRGISPGIPPVLRGGSYVVVPELGPDETLDADRQVLAGTYRTVRAVKDCYWETIDSAGEINDNNFVSAAPQVIMVVRSSDFAVNTERCGVWVWTG